MTYHCDRCRAALTPGALMCAGCGKRFDQPVPPDTDAPDAGLDALLRRRTAGGAAPPVPCPLLPAYYGTAARPPAQRRVGLIVGSVAVAAVAVLALAAWGADVLWMRGPGGEQAYVQHNLTGNDASEHGDFARAADEYSQMIALRPGRVDGYLLRGISEAQAGLISQSIADNTAALARTQEPMERGDLFYNRAQGRSRQGDQARAVADFTQSLGQYRLVRAPDELPDLPDRVDDTFRQRADSFWQMKNYAGAVADSNYVLSHPHARPTDYNVRAKAEAALGRVAAAQADFTQALRLDQTFGEGYFGLADLLGKQRRYAEAVSVYRRAVQADPGIAQFWGSLGWFQYEAGQRSQAIASDLHAQSLDPTQGWINYNLALCYAVSGDAARAQSAYADALAAGPPSARPGAMSDLHDALAKQPQSPVLRQALQQVERGRIGQPHQIRRRPPPASPAPPVASAFASMLAPEVTVAGYGLRPPAGFILTQRPLVALDGTGTVWLWTGRRRPDGTAPDIEVTISQDDGSMAAHVTSRQEVQSDMADMADNHSNLTMSPVTGLAVHSLPFAQGHWSGTGQRTGKTFDGLVYVSLTPSHYIDIVCHDARPYSRATLPLLRVSALTLRKM